MIEQGLKFLADLATKAMSPQIIKDVDERRVYYVLNGEQHCILRPGEPRFHGANSLDDLIAIANARLMDDMEPIVWYREQGADLILNDDGDRKDRVKMDFAYSDQFDRLRRLRLSPEWLKPKSFVRLLRIDLAGSMEPGVLLNSVKTLKFDNGVISKVEIARGRESLASEVKSKVESPLEIPEEVVVQIPVYKTMGLKDRYGVRCAVEVEPAEGLLQLLPLPDEIERVMHLAISAIGERLVNGLDKKIPCFYGTP